MTYLRHLDDTFSFGKFCNRSLGEVLLFAPNYLNWVVSNVDGHIFVLSDSAVEEIKLMFPNFLISTEFETDRLRQIDEYNIPIQKERRYHRSFRYESPDTYDNYNGSYAQDEMGYSDDEIDTIFDGDPLAYWNID